MSESSLSRFESGISTPSFEDVCSIASSLGWPLLYFASGRERTGSDPRDLAANLRFWGLSDQPTDLVIGEARPFEDLIVQCLGNESSARLVEAVPALLLKNDFDATALFTRSDNRGETSRLGWACEIAGWIASQLRSVAIRPDATSKLRSLREKAFARVRPREDWDLFGREPSDDEDDRNGWFESALQGTPPITRKWRIVFDTPQAAFLERAREILAEKRG